MPDKEYEVQQAKIHEVSLVPAGANGEEFAMFKSKEQDSQQKEEEFDSKEMDKDTTENDESEQNLEETETTKEGGSNEPVEFEDVEEFIEEKELEDEQRDELLNKLGVELEEKEEEEEEEESEIEKSDLPEEIQQQLEKAEEYEEMKEQREFDEMKKQVEEDFGFLPGETDENAEILKSVKDRVDEEDFDSLVSKLNALSEQIDLEKTFEEAGTQDTVPQGDAFEQATQLAEDKMEKGNYDNIATARKEVWDENPELLEEYQKQRRQQKST